MGTIAVPLNLVLMLFWTGGGEDVAKISGPTSKETDGSDIWAEIVDVFVGLALREFSC
jgi:hypothetical protein